jgi:hypothetical protein
MTLRPNAHDDELLTNGSYAGAELCHVCAVKAAFTINNKKRERERNMSSLDNTKYTRGQHGNRR